MPLWTGGEFHAAVSIYIWRPAYSFLCPCGRAGNFTRGRGGGSRGRLRFYALVDGRGISLCTMSPRLSSARVSMPLWAGGEFHRRARLRTGLGRAVSMPLWTGGEFHPEAEYRAAFYRLVSMPLWTGGEFHAP